MTGRRLRVLMPDIEFSHVLWTEPIGIRSPRFLNCLARGSSELSCGDLSRRLKEIECQMGSSSEEHRHGRVAIDIDLLQFDSERLRPADWQRPYQYYIATGEYPLIRSVWAIVTDPRSRSTLRSFYFFLKDNVGQRVICNSSQLLPRNQVQVREVNVN